MKIAPARPRHAAALARILAGWARETPWMPRLHDRAEDRRFVRLLIERGEVLILRGWTGPAGFIAREGEIVHALYVARRMRGRGAGKRLLDIAKARSPRLSLWAFQANERARAFYAREGFAEVEHTDGAGNDEKLPDVRLVWERMQR